MKIANFTIKFKTKDRLTLPKFQGSALRGAFGKAFRKICCPFINKPCTQCLLKDKCVYAYVFETPRPPNSEIMRKYETVPHPFIFEPPTISKQVYQPNENFTFNLILIGKAIDYVPYFIYAIDEMGKYGLGKNRGKLELVSVKQGRQIIYDGKDKKIKSEVKTKELKLTNSKEQVSKIKIKFLTPFRIIYQSKITQSLDFHILIRSLLRRIGLLSYFHSDQPYKINFTDLIAKAEKVHILQSNLSYQKQSRYSTRQHQRIPIEGMIGEITYEGNLTEFIPYLKIGEMVHIGKGTVFGMGKYKMEAIR